LFGNLLFDQGRFHEAWADDIGADIVFGPLLRHDAGKAEDAVLGRDIGRFER
jgi:hypothetical protein